MSNKIKSSIEWLENELKERYPLMNSEPLFEKSKAMHKEEHENTWLDSRIADKGDNYIGKQKTFTEYYNETYGGDKWAINKVARDKK